MFFLYVAHSALLDTRLLLKPSLKSDNKKYVTGLWASQKAKRRNENQKKVENAFDKNGPTIVPIAGLTVLEAGEKMYNRAVAEPETWYGNCGDQSLISLYLCYRYGAAPKYLWQYTYERGNFAHSLVVLADLRNPKDPEPACCDPWMDIACYYDEYKDKADGQLKEWTRQGKRLKYGKKGAGIFEHMAWVEPSHRAILGFGGDNPKYWYNANDKPKVNEKRN